MQKKNKFQRFIQEKDPKTKEKDSENKSKFNIFSDNQTFVITTHQYSQHPIDIIISEEAIESCPMFLDVSVKDSNVKFVVLVTKDSFQHAQNRNTISILRNITDLYKIDYDIGKFEASFRRVNNSERTYNLSIIEICIKDHFFSRRDQLQINNKILNQTCYTNKQIQLGSVKLKITNMMQMGLSNQEYVYTGIITEETSIIYRSLESKTAILIEVSEDLFMVDAVGEITLESIQKFLRIYQLRNQYFQTNHKLEIILFARIYFPQFTDLQKCYELYQEPTGLDYFPPYFQLDSLNRVCMDVYKKVPQKKQLKQFDQFSAQCINAIQEFIYQINCKMTLQSFKYLNDNFSKKNTKITQLLYPQGELSSSKNSNLLEAITLVTQHLRQDYATRSLTNSGHCLIILSPGNGYYFGNHHNYKIAKRNASKNNIICYLNAFGRIPDICAPMFLLTPNESPLHEEQVDTFKFAQNYFNHTSIVEENITMKYPLFDRLTPNSATNSILRHAYWINIIKYNDEFLKSYYTLYDRPTVNDYFQLCLKKQSPISFSQADFTLRQYAQPKEIPFSNEMDTTLQNIIKQMADGRSQRDLNEELIKLQVREHQLEEKPEQIQPKEFISQSQMPNIFNIRNYERWKEGEQAVVIEQPQKPFKIAETKSTKLYSYNRMKWNLYHWDSKIHQFSYSMKEHYHKLFKQLLQGAVLSNYDQELFKMETIWKALCCVPLAPLQITFCYKEINEFKTSRVQRFVEPTQKFSEFEQQAMGVLLSENFQVLSMTESTDEYGSKPQIEQKSFKAVIPVKFIKGEFLVTLLYNREQKIYFYEHYSKKKKKPELLPNRYSIRDNRILLHPIHYKYLMLGEIVTCKQILLEDSVDCDIKNLINCFDQTQEYNAENIANLRPKGISLIFINQESLQMNNVQAIYQKWLSNVKDFLDNLKTELPILKDTLRLQIIMKKKDVKQRQANYFNISYKTDLPGYIPHLHPEQFEKLCVSQQQYWCPKSVFHLGFSWVSSGTIPLLEILKITNKCAINAKLYQLQIPQQIEYQFIRNLPFESIIKLRCKQQSTVNKVKKLIKFPPFECVHDCSTNECIYIHKQALFFLKLMPHKSCIIWKENGLVNESQMNAELIKELRIKLCDLINKIDMESI